MTNLNFPNYVKVADLGCASGQNTLLTISEIVNTITVLCQKCNTKPPEIDCCLNDLPNNDFNFIPFFNKRVKSKGLCFVSGIPGSFYSRLFPRESLHFVHSSYSLHFLSKVPEGLEKNTSSVCITTSSPLSVYKAYLNQFQRDFTTFLKLRSEEMGVVSASKVDSFNMPFYDPSKEEVMEITGNEGSFKINDLEIHGFDLGQSKDNEENKLNSEKCKAAEKEAKTIRAASEPITSKKHAYTHKSFVGPVSGPEEAEFVLKRTQGCVHGFYGASSMERLPVEEAITSTVHKYNSIAIK